MKRQTCTTQMSLEPTQNFSTAQPIQNKDVLLRWFSKIAELSLPEVEAFGHVVGLRDKRTGPRPDYAKIKVEIEPSAELDLTHTLGKQSENIESYIEWAFFGILDVILTVGVRPLKKVKINIMEIEADDVKSNQMAFRWAGRDAGYKIIEMIENSMISHNSPKL